VRRQAGFTLLELMVTVAIIAILAGVAVPSFFSSSRKAKAASEVGTMFSDLRTRMDQYALENGVYPATQTETATWPAAPTPQTQPVLPLPASWTALKVRLSGPSDVYCGYSWITGVANDNSNIGAIAAAAPFSFTAPSTNWYYLFAHCDMDGDNSIDSYYFSSSVDTKIRVKNEGH
jgi:type IV pilus assembly protein PilE